MPDHRAPSFQAPKSSDAVVGVFNRDDLSRALGATHRAGFGPQARVFDAARSDLQGQLERAGVRLPRPLDADPSTVLILVNAPGRSARVADTFARAGARHVDICGGPTPTSPTQTIDPPAAPPFLTTSEHAETT